MKIKIWVSFILAFSICCLMVIPSSCNLIESEDEPVTHCSIVDRTSKTFSVTENQFMVNTVSYEGDICVVEYSSYQNQICAGKPVKVVLNAELDTCFSTDVYMQFRLKWGSDPLQEIRHDFVGRTDYDVIFEYHDEIEFTPNYWIIMDDHAIVDWKVRYCFKSKFNNPSADLVILGNLFRGFTVVFYYYPY